MSDTLNALGYGFPPFMSALNVIIVSETFAYHFPKFSSPRFMLNLLLFSISFTLYANEHNHDENFNLSHVFTTFTVVFSPPTFLHQCSRFQHHRC